MTYLEGKLEEIIEECDIPVTIATQYERDASSYLGAIVDFVILLETASLLTLSREQVDDLLSLARSIDECFIQLYLTRDPQWSATKLHEIKLEVDALYLLFLESTDGGGFRHKSLRDDVDRVGWVNA